MLCVALRMSYHVPPRLRHHLYTSALVVPNVPCWTQTVFGLLIISRAHGEGWKFHWLCVTQIPGLVVVNFTFYSD
jgi:hypothetical protein